MFDSLNDSSCGIGVVNENDSFFIQSKSKLSVLSHALRSVRQGKCPGQGIIVNFNFGVVDLCRIQIQINPHIKQFFLPLPLSIRQDSDKLALP